jgi:hypothetical protein
VAQSEQRIRIAGGQSPGEAAAEAVAELLRNAEAIEDAGGDARMSRTWQTLWELCGRRAPSLAKFSPKRVAADCCIDATTFIRAIDRLVTLGVAQWHTKPRGTGAKFWVRVLLPVEVLDDSLKVKPAPQQRQAWPDDPPESTCVSAGAAQVVSPTQALQPNTPPIRAGAHSNDLNEVNEDLSRSFRSQGAAPPETPTFSSRSFRSPVAHLDADARGDLGDRVLDEWQRISVLLNNPIGTFPWIFIVAAYLEIVSGAVSQADIEDAIFAAKNPGDAARIRHTGRLFTGKLKSLIFSKRDQLADLTLFARTPLAEAIGPKDHGKILPKPPCVRRCMAELSVDADDRWFQDGLANGGSN